MNYGNNEVQNRKNSSKEKNNNKKSSWLKLSLYIIGGVILVSLAITLITLNIDSKEDNTNGDDDTNINEKNEAEYDYNSIEELKEAAEGWGQKVQVIDTVYEETIKIDTLVEAKNFADLLAKGNFSASLDDDNLFELIYFIIHTSNDVDTIECINDKIINQALYNLFDKKNVKIQSSMASVPNYYCSVFGGNGWGYPLKSEEVDNQTDNSITYKYIFEGDDGDGAGLHQYTKYIEFVKNTKDNLYKVVRFDKVDNY